jgi:elongin-A
MPQILQEAEAKRLEEIGSRIRSQRLEADERKKGREVKMTDSVLPMKRPRTGCKSVRFLLFFPILTLLLVGSTSPTPPKTLFQKTRTEASKLQKSIYSARILPPMPGGKGYRPLPKTSNTPIHLATPSAASGSRVTVKTVQYRRPSVTLPAPVATPTSSPIAISTAPIKKPAPLPSSLTAPTDNPSPKPLPPPKKDPMATLFMPKHRTFSQLRSQEVSRRAVPSR